MSKWEFIVREQCGGQRIENYWEETSGVNGGFCLNQAIKILAEGRTDAQASPVGWWVMRNLIRCQGWSHSGVGRVYSTDLAGFYLNKIGWCRDEHRYPRVRSGWKSVQGSLSRVWSMRESVSTFSMLFDNKLLVFCSSCKSLLVVGQGCVFL